jgi:hypothetical protein
VGPGEQMERRFTIADQGNGRNRRKEDGRNLSTIRMHGLR